MTDREQSTAAAAARPDPPPPPSPEEPVSPPSPLDAWKELQPIRETFLHHVGHAETQQALRAIGDYFYQAVLEWRNFPETETPIILLELEAVAKDVRYLQGFLHHTVADDGRGTLADARYERWLKVKAEEWADTLGEVATEIEKAVAE